MGNGKQSKKVYRKYKILWGREEWKVVAITDSLTERTNGSFLGIPVYSYKE